MKRARHVALVSVFMAALPGAARAQVCLMFDQFGGMMQDDPKSCGPYTDPVSPGPLDAYEVQVAVPADAAVDRMRLYYTVDGAAPSGELGEPGDAHTHVVQGEKVCTYGPDPVREEPGGDVFKAAIPAMPRDTVVTFVLSVWKEGDGGDGRTEWFADAGSSECSCTSSSCAQQYAYTVGEGEPRPLPDEYVVLADTPLVIAAPGLLKNDRYLDAVTFELTLSTESNGAIEINDDGSFVYAPAPGFLGVDKFTYVLTAYGGEYQSNPATVRIAVRMPPPLVSTTQVGPGQGGCAAGGQRIDAGLDNGLVGGVPLDGALQPSEITSTSYVCNGGAGGAGAAGVSARVLVSAEPEGANCAKGGQRIESGLDANGNGTLDSNEISSTAHVCNGAPGKSGCSAAPGALSLAGALATLAWAGMARRRRGTDRR
jgi:hypothetical protein